MNGAVKRMKSLSVGSDRIQVWIVATVWCILFGLLFAFGGCAPEDTLKPKETSETKPGENFSAKVTPLTDPNKYEVQLEWSSADKPLQWIIHRKEGEQKLESTQVAVVSGSQNDIKDPSVEPGKEYTYFLGAVQDPNYTLKGKAKASIPKDLEFRGEISIKGLLQGNRLFLRDGAKLQTLGESVSFEVNELLASYAIIDTSPPQGVNGRPCGEISIKANSARGRLTIQCRATNGANGPDGGNGRNGDPGGQGSPGDVDVKPNEQLPVHKDAAERAQLKHWYATNTLPTGAVRPDGWKLWFYCSRPPGDGALGEPGANGGDGTSGGDGGNSSAISVEVKNDLDFQAKALVVPGEGAVGGRGGNGGKGAPGGPPGRPDPSGFLCPTAKQGPSGPDGLNGRPGRYGQKGTVRRVCIRIGERISGDCK